MISILFQRSSPSKNLLVKFRGMYSFPCWCIILLAISLNFFHATKGAWISEEMQAKIFCTGVGALLLLGVNESRIQPLIDNEVKHKTENMTHMKLNETLFRKLDDDNETEREDTLRKIFLDENRNLKTHIEPDKSESKSVNKKISKQLDSPEIQFKDSERLMGYDIKDPRKLIHEGQERCYSMIRQSVNKHVKEAMKQKAKEKWNSMKFSFWRSRKNDSSTENSSSSSSSNEHPTGSMNISRDILHTRSSHGEATPSLSDNGFKNSSY